MMLAGLFLDPQPTRILIIGLGIAAYLLNVPPTWILVGVIVLLGIGVLMATSRTKPRDPPAV